MMTYLGRISSTILAYSLQRPLRVPSLIPERFPALETSWHGKPPQLASTHQSDVFMDGDARPVSGKDGAAEGIHLAKELMIETCPGEAEIA